MRIIRMKSHIKSVLLLLFVLAFFNAQDGYTKERTHWVEIGEGTYEFGFTYPYKIKFFVPYGVRNIKDIKAGLFPMRFELNWLAIEYPKEKVQKLFNKQIEEHFSSPANFKLSNNLIHLFLRKLPPVKKHDQWVFTYYPDEGAKLFIKDKKIHHLVGAELNRALVQSWLDQSPVLTANLLKRLLKLQK